MATPTPNRGEVWLVDLGMAAKIRPSLVLSIPADDENDRVLTTLIPHTTSTRESRFPRMNLLKRPLLIAGFIVLSLGTWFVGRFVYVWWHVPEAYAAWDAGDMLLWYMRSHKNAWPENWDEFQAAVESEPALFLRGRHPEEPDYMGRMRRTIRIDWSFDPADPKNPTPVTRPDGSPLHAYWSDPNGMIYQYLERQKNDERTDPPQPRNEVCSSG